MALLTWKIKSRIETLLQTSKYFHDLLPRFIATLPEDVFFVEIGANDGINFDPIYETVVSKNWSGVYIEPQKKVFETLKGNFEGKENIYFENIAITKTDTFIDLYSPNDQLVTENTLVASMELNNGVLRHFDKDQLKKETVEGKPFEYIVDKYDLLSKKRTLLLIDVEGFEKDVIDSIDFSSFKPSYLIFEHAHLTYDIHREINAGLVKKGYKIYLDKYDTLAILNTN